MTSTMTEPTLRGAGAAEFDPAGFDYNGFSTGYALTSSRGTTWTARLLAAASRGSTWQTAGSAPATTPVTGSRATTWRALLSVNAFRSSTWQVLLRVTPTRASTWQVAAPGTAEFEPASFRAADFTTGQATVVASRASSWRAIAAVSATRAASWGTLATALDFEPGSFRGADFTTGQASVDVSRGSTWRVRVPPGTPDYEPTDFDHADYSGDAEGFAEVDMRVGSALAATGVVEGRTTLRTDSQVRAAAVVSLAVRATCSTGSALTVTALTARAPVDVPGGPASLTTGTQLRATAGRTQAAAVTAATSSRMTATVARLISAEARLTQGTTAGWLPPPSVAPGRAVLTHSGLGTVVLTHNGLADADITFADQYAALR